MTLPSLPNQVTPLPPTAVGRFTCPRCPGRFDSVGDKKRHLRDTHPSEIHPTHEKRTP